MNNWYVVTGAPSSGKTTILKELEKKGYKVIYEMARQYIDAEIKKGKTIKDIRKDEKKFQEEVLKLKIDFEKNLSPTELIFLERGIPDTLAYYKLHNFQVDDAFFKVHQKAKYKKVFILDLIEYKVDYARTERTGQAFQLQKLLEQAYNNKIVKIPAVSVEERVKIIIGNI